MSKSRKFLSVLLSLLMLIAFADIPSLGLKAYAEATEYDLWVNNERITSDHLTVTCGTGTAVYDPAAKTLTLNGAHITNGCELDWLDSGIVSRLDSLTVIVASDSKISGITGVGIDTYDFDWPENVSIPHNVTIKGSDKLEIDYDAYAGFYITGNVAVNGVSLDMGKLWAGKDLTITDSDIVINSSNYGMVCNNGTITITNSDIDITSDGSCILLGNDVNSSTLIFNSEKLKLNSKGTAMSSSYPPEPMSGYGIESFVSGSTLTINGGTIDITTTSGNKGTNIPAANIELGSGIDVSVGASLQSGGHVVVEKLYTVTYDGNGAASGTAPADSMKYPSGASVTVSDNTGSLAKTGYVFDGWNTKANGSGTSYAAGGTFNISDDTKLYAKWTAHTSHTFAATGAADNNDGTHSKTCTVCNAVVKEDHSVPVMMNNNDGTHGGICTDCGAAVKTAHTYGEYTYLNPLGGGDPSLTEHHRLCSVCFAEEVSAHVKDKGTVTKEPTKTEEGERVYKCTLCGLPIETEVIPVLTETTYTVTVTGGTADKTAAAEGETVTVTATVPEGKKFRSWTVKSGGITLANTATATFTMPANAVEVIAVYEDIPANAYTVTVNNGTGGGEYAEGETVTITANTPATGKRFKEWKVISGGITLAKTATATFTMPAKAVEVTAVYEDIPAVTYAVTVNNGTGGGEYAEGETVTITANTPAEGKRFKEWKVISGGITLAKTATAIFTMPANAVEVTAVYEDIPANAYTVTVNNGAGSGKFAEGETVTISANVPSGKKFKQWNVVKGGITLADKSAAVTTFKMPANDVEVTAEFENITSNPSEPSNPGKPSNPDKPSDPGDTSNNNTSDNKEQKEPSVKVTKQNSTSVSLEWKKVEGVDGYVVETLNENGEWERITRIKGGDNTSFDIKNLTPATTYTFRVRAYTVKDGKRYVKKSGEQITVTTNPDKVQKFKAAEVTKNSIKLSWKKDKNADGYQLQMYKKGKWVNVKIYDKNTIVGRTIKGLKSKTTYKFRIRSFKLDENGKKIYGKYSTIKAKTK